MARKHLLISDELYQYILSGTTPETKPQAQLRQKTMEMTGLSQMMTTPDQVKLLQFFIHLIQAKNAIEVGVFTGYGSLAIAQALPEEGHLVSCDTNQEWVEIGRPFWQAAGVLSKIEVKMGEAIASLQALLEEGKGGSFDFIFIDADKANYPTYYELSLQLLRPGGLMIFDNMLQVKGQLIYLQNKQISRTLAEFNQQLLSDKRVMISLIPLGGGMLLAQKLV